ncbi:MAG: RNA-binding protein [Flavisolibacter sp.]|jgi:RNA recognition motif-containing protein|nr:RNA-binding protein [Flavisolibacter sp.]
MNIFVSNLGDNITDASLEAIFSTHGTVNSTEVVYDQVTGFSRGFAFVQMPHEVEAANTIKRLDGAVINGRSIVVKEAGELSNEK